MAPKEQLEIEAGRVAGIYYTLTNEAGEVLDTNRAGGKPLAFLAGAGNIVKGLEQGLLGHKKGEHVEVVVQPEDGYGPSREELIQEIPRANFPAEMEFQAGMTVTGSNDQGQELQALILEVGEETVRIDQNHRLAGKVLNFEVTIVGVRQGDASELALGHPRSGPPGKQASKG